MKKIATKKHFICFSIFLTILFLLNFEQKSLAQNQAELEQEKVEVNKVNEFELIAKPPVKTKAKVAPLTVLKISKDEEVDFSKTITFSRLTFRDIPNELAPTIPKELKGNYVKAGFGNYITPYFEGFYSRNLNENNKVGVFAHHLSSMNGIVDKENSAYGNTNVLLFSEHTKERFILSSSVNYNLERVHYYGYNSDIETPNKKDIQQTYHRLETKLNLISLPKKDELGEISGSKLGYKFSVGFNYFDAINDVNEWQIPVLGEVVYSFSEKSNLKFDTEFNQTQQKNSIALQNNTLTNNRTLASLTPSYNFNSDNLTMNVGAGVAYSSDSLLENSTESNIFFYPAINISYQLKKDKFWLLGEIGGGVKPQFLSMLTVQNPFLASVQPLSHTFSQLDASFALQTKFHKNVKANAEIGYAMYDNMPFFTPSFSEVSKFNVVYDNVNILRTGVSAAYQKSQFNARLSANYFNYSLTDLKVAHHRPDIQTSINISYIFFDKLTTELSMIQLFGLQTQNSVGETVNLKPIHDLSTKISYRFTERISAFANGYNLIGQNYERFIGYPNNGITVVVGGKFIF
ncbi:hypothetical protein [Bernardetia sp.]|uniref:hypothetical protein n=1 Tax=Bernardetia sp. TaxID=1937974 RepID=UPI0025C60EA2|nr:hypothetical protein [Bernardetia sp.]